MAVTAIDNVVFDNIKYLHIDTLLTDRRVLRILLQRCPNLQYYIGASSETCRAWNKYFSQAVPDSVPFGEAVRWCPKLKYHMATGTYHDKDSLNYLIDDHIMYIHKNHH